MEFALLAIKDTILKTEPAFSLISTAQPTSDVKDGTGTIKNVSNVQQDGLWEPTVSVLPLTMLAQPGVLMELALLAIKDTILKTEPAFSLISTAQLTSDVKDGTGTIKNVLNAQQDGPWVPTVSVLPLMMFVLHGVLMEFAQLATRVTVLIMEFAFSLISTVQLI
jgi:hypothetical protein